MPDVRTFDKSTAFSVSIVVMLVAIAFWSGIMYEQVRLHTRLPYHVGVADKFVSKEDLKLTIEQFRIELKEIKQELREIKNSK